MSRAKLRVAILYGADLHEADLSVADLYEANLRGANLYGADLRGANLSQVKGLLNPSRWIKDNFKRTKEGYIVYKAFGHTIYNQKCFGTIKKGKIIREVVNPDRGTDCGCGINFATLNWVKNNYSNSTIRKCLLRWEDLATLVVPFNTNGKARCGSLKVLEIVK